jgi:hypothetical protein
MHRVCAANGIPYFHFLQPNQYDLESKPLTAGERALLLEADDPHRTTIEIGYPLLARAGGRLTAAGVRFHDLRRIFVDRTETLYSDPCCHLNAHGNDLLVDAVTAAIAADSRLPSDRPASGTPAPRGGASVSGIAVLAPSGRSARP